jgi:hypothetical protein
MSLNGAVLTALAMLLVAAVIGGITYAVNENVKADRAMVRSCIDSGRSPVECRVAVKGTR